MRWSSGIGKAGLIGAAAASLCACASAGHGGIDTAKIQLDDIDNPAAGAVQVASLDTTSLDRHPRLGLKTPIAKICSYPGGKAVLDTDLPGLTTRPEYIFFSHMSLKKLQDASRGKLKDEDLAKVDADLRALP